MPFELQDQMTGSGKPPATKSADLTSIDTQSTLQWVRDSLHGAGSTFLSAFSGCGTKREISEFVKELYREYVRMEKIGRSEIDHGPRNTRHVWPFIEDFCNDFNSHESELKAQGRNVIGLNPGQLDQLSLAYLSISPRDWPNKPKKRCWSLNEHEELRDLLTSEP